VSYPSAISPSEQVVGHSYTVGPGILHDDAFSWTKAGGMVDLGTLGGFGSAANAVSASGQVVGSADTPNGYSHAFSWTPAGGMVDLGTLGNDVSSSATAIGSNGQVVGVSYSNDYPARIHAFSWTQAGGMVALPTLGGVTSFANAVNPSGKIVGDIDGAATLWQR
jgi:probable HAF family extracellular repeat protein